VKLWNAVIFAPNWCYRIGMPATDLDKKGVAEGRYQTLLEVSSTIAAQPNVATVLKSLRRLLSSVVEFDAISLALLDSSARTVRVIALDKNPGVPHLEVGAQASIEGTTIGQVIDQQEPAFVPDMAANPRAIAGAPERFRGTQYSAYYFPVSVGGKKLGVLIFINSKKKDFSTEDVELLSSLAAHVAVGLESALANDAAALYQHELAAERDRLKLLLEINNCVVSELEIKDLFRSAAASLRRYFSSDFAGFWLMDSQAKNLECLLLDFPESVDVLDDVQVAQITERGMESMRARHSEIWSLTDMETNLPVPVLTPLKAESISSMMVVPLATSTGPLGVIALGTRRPNSFVRRDLDLLSQISTQISLAVDNALAYGRLTASKDRLEEERLYLESEIRSEYNFENIVGKSPALRKVLDQIAIVAPTDSTALLRGETGTGKELVARAIHSLSPRKDRTFVRLNCAAIPSGLVESELFGHEKGAFTGALMQKKGRFELADQGTLFLDEIGDISLELQPKLLRALQEQEFERLGSTKTIHVNVRLIAATHRDLGDMIAKGQFREDLFYRLNVFPVEVPPLRERREDIPLLVHYFVSHLATRMRKRIRSIPKAAMDALTAAPWPGNIRELENFIERAVILTQGDELNVPTSELQRSAGRGSPSASASTFHDAERQTIIDALKAASGRIAGKDGAAERLGLKRTTLQNKMRKLNVTKHDY